MKLTLWQRLNATLIGLILLLMAGFLLELWVKESYWTAANRGEQLSGSKDRLYMDMMQLSDAMRGVLLDAKNDFEKRRRDSAKTDLGGTFDKIQGAFSDRPRLMGSLKKLRDFVTEKLHPFHGRVAEMAETDPSGALALYSRNFPEVRDGGEKLFRDLAEQVAKVTEEDDRRA